MFLGLTSVQWLLLAAFVAGSLVVAILLSKLVGSILRTVMRRFAMVPNDAVVRAVARSLALGVVAETDRWFVPLLGLTQTATDSVRLWIDAFAVVFVVIAAYRLVDLLCHRLVEHFLRHRSNARDSTVTLAPLIASATKVLVVVIGATTVLGLLGVNVAAIITGLSIGGAALALASQDTIRNLFGSMMILADEPFAVGDWVVVQGAEGVVEEIGFRSTRIRTFADSVITVPNGRLADMTVDNMGLRTLRRYRTVVFLEASTDAARIDAFVREVRTLVETHPLTVKDPTKITVALTDLTAQGLGVTVVMFVPTADMQDEAMFKHEINLGMLHAAARVGVHTARPADQPQPSPPGTV
jgi:MscS family membrane protein